MKLALRNFLIGMSAVLFGPADALPRPAFRITVPPENATQAIGFDFSNISRDFLRATRQVEQAKQLDLKF